MDDDDSSDDDDALLHAWRNGDRAAGGRLVDRYHPKIVAFFMNKVHSDAQCDDLVQATFIALLESIERFRGESSFRTYLFSIARYKLYRYYRDVTRDRLRFDPDETSIMAIDASPSQVLALRDQDRLLLEALRSLPFETQVILELHYWEHMKCKEIAVVVGRPLSTVTDLMSRGRRRLKARMAELAESPEQLETSISRISEWARRLRRDADDDGA